MGLILNVVKDTPSSVCFGSTPSFPDSHYSTVSNVNDLIN